jgi:hypothetical protein
MITHSSTSRPVQCLCMAERTGCPILSDLWSYVRFLLHVRFLKVWTELGKRRAKDEMESSAGSDREIMLISVSC